ncbi:hypothetical protein BC826DRAFT_659275 [Russula brevipes]|nr:hypothetical protein BC826DRAFT_659275 [Russula brevipes]
MSTVIDTPLPPFKLGELREGLLVLIDDPNADIILRSCDHHEFRVPRLYIVQASPVLRELIKSLPSSQAVNGAASLPSIKLSDSGVILSHLLTFVLPMVPVLPSTTEQTMLLLSVAQKYQMNSTLCHLRAIVVSQDPPFIRPETAFRVYSLAQMHGLRQEALQAGRATLTFPFKLEDLEDELSTVPGTYLHELWQYYQRVRTHLKSDIAALKDTGATILTSTAPCSNITSNGKLAWVDAYIESIAVSPELFDLSEFYICLTRHAQMGYRPCQCMAIPRKTIHTFWMALTNAVHSCMTKVRIDDLRNCMIPVIV